jgi:hypothetical protein
VQRSSVLWLQDNELHVIDAISKAAERPIQMHSGIKTVSWNKTEYIELVSYEYEEGDRYEIISIQKQISVNTHEDPSVVWSPRSMIGSFNS